MRQDCQQGTFQGNLWFEETRLNNVSCGIGSTLSRGKGEDGERKSSLRYSKENFQCQMKSGRNVDNWISTLTLGALFWLSFPPHWQKLGGEEGTEEEEKEIFAKETGFFLHC